MNEDLIADLWNVTVEYVKDNKDDLANDFVNILMDHGIKESTLVSLKGVDDTLDEAIDYAIDDEHTDDELFD